MILDLLVSFLVTAILWVDVFSFFFFLRSMKIVCKPKLHILKSMFIKIVILHFKNKSYQNKKIWF